jgi:hypothetical protein
MAKSEPLYRLVVFDEVDDPTAVRDLFVKVTGMHPTDAMQWVARCPGVWAKPLTADQARELLDGLFVLGVAAEARLADNFPELSPTRTIHDAACLPEGFRVKGLRGEPTHWVPWDKVEMLAAGRVAAPDEFRSVSPPSWPSAAAAAFRAFTLRNPHPFERKARAHRVPRDPVGEVLIVRKDPRLVFRVPENQMNYAYLGDRLSPSASANFPLFLADLVARADSAYVTESTRVLLGHARPDDPEAVAEALPAAATFASPQALLDYATHRLLWSWYLRDRDAARDTPRDETQHD